MMMMVVLMMMVMVMVLVIVMVMVMVVVVVTSIKATECFAQTHAPLAGRGVSHSEIPPAEISPAPLLTKNLH